MPMKVGKVELYMGPHTLAGPDNLEAAIVDFINGAQKRLDIAVQELDNENIGKAIIEARQRGVRVNLVLELDYLRSIPGQKDPFSPGGSTEINRILHDAALRAGIKVNADFNSNIFHQKFIVRDSTSLLTGSTNFTKTGVSTNLNHIVIVHDHDLALEYTREFREIQRGRFGRYSEPNGPRPTELTVSNLPMKVLFAPEHNPEMEIMKQIAKAKHQVDFAIFTFSVSSGIDDQIALAKQAGIDVRGVFDARQGNQSWAARDTLRDAGASLFLIHEQPVGQNRLRKLHHKLMVIDNQVVIVGSFNYTGPANALNDENIIIIGDLESTKRRSIDAQKKIANYAKEEIDRIIDQFGQPI